MKQVLHLRSVPTRRPRHTITETDEVARALDEAAERWPGVHGARARLLLLLIAEGHRSIAEQRRLEAARRREAIQATSGALTGTYPDDYLESLRDDWAA